MGKLESLEFSYKEQKEQAIAELFSYVRQLAVLSDTQAIRAQVLRELYWNRKISVEIIGRAFGLPVGNVRKHAGSLIMEIPCEESCGANIKKAFTSRAKLEDYYEHFDQRKSNALFARNVCESCIKRIKAEEQEAASRKERYARQRNQQLRAMSWKDFIKTKEWIEVRNTLLYVAEYQCEVCHDKEASLYIYPHIDTPQDSPGLYNIRSNQYNYFVLCKECVPRCSDLISEARVEYVNRIRILEIRKMRSSGEEWQDYD